MIKTEYKKYMKEVHEEVETCMYCDYCEKEIRNGKGFINVISSHNDWGNDSIESYKNADVHKECLQKYLKWLFSEDSTLYSLYNAYDWKIEIETDVCVINNKEE